MPRPQRHGGLHAAVSGVVAAPAAADITLAARVGQLTLIEDHLQQNEYMEVRKLSDDTSGA